MACMVMLSSDYSSRLASFTSIFIVIGIQSHNMNNFGTSLGFGTNFKNKFGRCLLRIM